MFQVFDSDESDVRDDEDVDVEDMESSQQPTCSTGGPRRELAESGGNDARSGENG